MMNINGCFIFSADRKERTQHENEELRLFTRRILSAMYDFGQIDDYAQGTGCYLGDEEQCFIVRTANSPETSILVLDLLARGLNQDSAIITNTTGEATLVSYGDDRRGCSYFTQIGTMTRIERSERHNYDGWTECANRYYTVIKDS